MSPAARTVLTASAHRIRLPNHRYAISRSFSNASNRTISRTRSNRQPDGQVRENTKRDHPFFRGIVNDSTHPTNVSDSRFYVDPPPQPPPHSEVEPVMRSDPPSRRLGRLADVSPILLRDLCECTACIDPSTKQKLFSTADIPSNIGFGHISMDEQLDGVSIKWVHDVPSYNAAHTTSLTQERLHRLQQFERTAPVEFTPQLPAQTPWNNAAYRPLPDFDYSAYMQDDAVLFTALRQLHTHGLMFLTGVPESEHSVSTIAERIGPLKNTFYGSTWDVRSVPEAKNVAYTSQDLGFHMDLLYMHQPPHIQLLHCIRSSASGGASLFTDSYATALDMWHNDFDHFCQLASNNVNFHYHHPSSHLYSNSWPVFELGPLHYRGVHFNNDLKAFRSWYETGVSPSSEAYKNQSGKSPRKSMEMLRHLTSVNWSPPFQAPFGVTGTNIGRTNGHTRLGRKVEEWHGAAQRFSQLIHRPEGIYDRLMKPGECVIFDNRRVLHARRAFNVGDAGKERWLRGAYVDKDPFFSKMRVLAASLE